MSWLTDHKKIACILMREGGEGKRYMDKLTKTASVKRQIKRKQLFMDKVKKQEDFNWLI